jgi:GIY-YIG catalytic domain-containing protein
MRLTVAVTSDPRGQVVDDRRQTSRALATLSQGPRLFMPEAVDGGVPDAAGLYAIYGDSGVWHTLGLENAPDGRPLYVGKSEDSLVLRDLNTHFATGETGWSSPRRSFAALLAGALELSAIPRRAANPEPKKYSCYALEEPGDESLSSWMHEHLSLAVWASPPGVDLATVEVSVMRALKPPLNLSGVEQPWKKQVKEARKVLASEARRWARARGFPV